MLFLFSISISLNLTHHKWEEIKKKDDAPPALIFAWAPWCPHCRAVFDAWAKLSAKYQNDPNIQVLSVNCTDQGSLCGVLGIRGYPSFFTLVNGAISSINVERNLNGFTKVIDNLKTKYQHVLDFTKKIKNAQYPAFVFKLRENDDAAYDIALRAAEELGLTKDTNFFFNFDNDLQGNCQLRAYASSEYYKLFKDRFLYKNIVNFINSYRIPLFGRWSFESLLKSNRIFILVFENIEEVKKQYHDIAVKYDEVLTFGDYSKGSYLSSSNSFLSSDELKSLFHVNSASQNVIILLNMAQNTDGTYSYYLIDDANKGKLEDFMNRYMEHSNVEWKHFNIPSQVGAQKVEKKREVQANQNDNNNNNNANNMNDLNDNDNDNDGDENHHSGDSKFIIMFVGIGVLICGVSVFAYRYFTTPQRKEE